MTWKDSFHPGRQFRQFFSNWQDIARPGMQIVPVLIPGRNSRHAEAPFRRA